MGRLWPAQGAPTHAVRLLPPPPFPETLQSGRAVGQTHTQPRVLLGSASVLVGHWWQVGSQAK